MFLTLSTAMSSICPTPPPPPSFPHLQFSNQVDHYDGYRHLGMLITLLVLLGLVVYLGVISLFDASSRCRPKQSCCCNFFNFFVHCLSLLLLLILWILAAALLLGTTVASDFCIDADNNLLEATKMQDQEIAVYIITCNTNASLANPFTSQISDITDGFDQADLTVVNLLDTIANETQCQDGGAYNTSCTAIKNSLLQLRAVFDNIETTVGRDTNGDSTYDTGLLSLLECAYLNRHYEMVVIAVCRDFTTTMAMTMELILAFAIIYLFTEIFTRCVREKAEKSGSRTAETGVLSWCSFRLEKCFLADCWAMQAMPPLQRWRQKAARAWKWWPWLARSCPPLAIRRRKTSWLTNFKSAAL